MVSTSECYMPGWGDGPENANGLPVECEFEDGHDGPHGGWSEYDNGYVYWDISWTVDDDDFPFPSDTEDD
jgi:hypothetical protein